MIEQPLYTEEEIDVMMAKYKRECHINSKKIRNMSHYEIMNREAYFNGEFPLNYLSPRDQHFVLTREEHGLQFLKSIPEIHFLAMNRTENSKPALPILGTLDEEYTKWKKDSAKRAFTGIRSQHEEIQIKKIKRAIQIEKLGIAEYEKQSKIERLQLREKVRVERELAKLERVERAQIRKELREKNALEKKRLKAERDAQKAIELAIKLKERKALESKRQKERHAKALIRHEEQKKKSEQKRLDVLNQRIIERAKRELNEDGEIPVVTFNSFEEFVQAMKHDVTDGKKKTLAQLANEEADRLEQEEAEEQEVRRVKRRIIRSTKREEEILRMTKRIEERAKKREERKKEAKLTPLQRYAKSAALKKTSKKIRDRRTNKHLKK